MPRVEPYSALARIYDAVSGRPGFDLYAPAYETLMGRAGLQPGRALDAACGTGLWTRRLAELGFTVVGVDRSEAMLERARRRCRGLPITLVAGDLLDLDVEGPFDLVTCTFDSLNYLGGPSALGRALSAFAAVLRPGGAAIFDTNTTAALCDRWATQTLVRRAAGAVGIWSTRWKRRSRTNTLTMEIFLRPKGAAEDCFERHVEVHVQHALDPDPVLRAALDAGFESTLAFDVSSLEPAGPATAKAVFVARTPG